MAACICCEPGCDLLAEYEVWPRGRPTGADCYRILSGEPYGGYVWYEAYTHACSLHLELAKSECPAEVFVVHLSRSESVLPLVSMVDNLN